MYYASLRRTINLARPGGIATSVLRRRIAGGGTLSPGRHQAGDHFGSPLDAALSNTSRLQTSNAASKLWRRAARRDKISDTPLRR